MAINPKHLNEGETVVLSTRTHPKVLIVPGIVLVVILAVAGFFSTLPDGAHTGLWRLIIWLLALIPFAVLVLWPFLNWYASTYTVTNRRLVTRKGVLTRTGHDIPLNRISDVSYERGVTDRMLGCGSLIISDASTHGRVVLPDIPQVEQAQLAIADLLFHGGQAGQTGGQAGSRHDDDGA